MPPRRARKYQRVNLACRKCKPDLFLGPWQSLYLGRISGLTYNLSHLCDGCGGGGLTQDGRSISSSTNE
jgi:hypothetical protein